MRNLDSADTEAEAPILWPPDMKSQLTRKDRDAGKHWRQKKVVSGDEIFGWHHRVKGHEFEQTLRDREQSILEFCSLYSCKELDMS